MTAANEAMIVHRKKKKQMEIEEDKQIEEWIRQKEARDAAEEERKAKIAAAKERECARLRAEQKKVSDGLEALDGLRARRAAEKKDREAREKELAEARARKESIDNMQKARAVQALAAARRRKIVVQDQRETFERNYRNQAAQMKVFRENEERKHRARVKNRDEILEQVKENEAKRKARQQQYIREGHEAVARRERELQRIEKIKQQKIKSLRDKGVPDRFMAEMINYDAQKIMMEDYKRGGKW